MDIERGRAVSIYVYIYEKLRKNPFKPIFLELCGFSRVGVIRLYTDLTVRTWVLFSRGGFTPTPRTVWVLMIHMIRYLGLGFRCFGARR